MSAHAAQEALLHHSHTSNLPQRCCHRQAQTVKPGATAAAWWPCAWMTGPRMPHAYTACVLASLEIAQRSTQQQRHGACTAAKQQTATPTTQQRPHRLATNHASIQHQHDTPSFQCKRVCSSRSRSSLRRIAHTGPWSSIRQQVHHSVHTPSSYRSHHARASHCIVTAATCGPPGDTPVRTHSHAYCCSH